jgi:hypothetical protein
MIPTKRVDSYSDMHLTTLVTTVNTALGLLNAALEACTKAELNYKRTREKTVFTVNLTIVTKALLFSLPHIDSIKITTAITETAIEAAVTAAMAAAPVPVTPSGYGPVQTICYWKAERPFWKWAALIPVYNQIGSDLRSVKTITNAGGALAYTILDTDEIISITTDANNVTPTTLPLVANSVGRRLTFILAASGGGTVTLTGAVATDIVNAAGAAVATLTIASVLSCVTLECDGVHWYTRGIQTIPASNRSVKSITTVGAGALAYPVDPADSIIECTTTGVGDITVTLEAVGALTRGHEVTFTYQTKATTGIVIIKGTAGTDLVSKAGLPVVDIRLNNVHETLTVISDGNHWYVKEQITAQNKVTAITTVGAGALAYTVLPEDQFITTTTTGAGNITITLPLVAGMAGRRVTVVQQIVNVGGGIVIVTTAVGANGLIDLAGTPKVTATWPITPFLTATFVCDGVKWITAQAHTGIVIA